jgi:cytochrome c
MTAPKSTGSMILHLLLTGACAMSFLVMLSFAHPFGDPRRADGSSGHLLAGAQIPEPLRNLLRSKCGNCHSEAGEWPLYSRIAPVSWLLERDVIEARSHMNLSRWDTYVNQEQVDLLARLAAEARNGEMPPARYTAIHPDSKLLPAEREALYNWTKAERKRLRAEGLQTKSER